MRLEEIFSRVSGKVKKDYSLSKLTWFKVGGLADYLFLPKDINDLAFFLKNKPKDVEVFVIGLGSNLLVRDGGFRGVVIRLPVDDIFIDEKKMQASFGAGTANATALMATLEKSLSGLEFFGAIPGTIGGLLRMNAGAYGVETKDVMISCKALDLDGNEHVFSVEDMGFSYRDCSLAKRGFIFTNATFSCKGGEKNLIKEEIIKLKELKASTQETGAKTGGSTFANPKGEYKAWELIDKAGCRGLKIGDAKVSEKHCNFILNLGNASARDIEDLIIAVKDRVLKETGVALREEIVIVGEEKI